MSAPLGGRTQPLHRAFTALCFTELVVSLKTTIDSPCMELVVSLKPAGERARRRCAGAPEMKARSPVRFMVCDVKVTAEDGFLVGSMMIKAKNTLFKKRTGSIVQPANCVSAFTSRHWRSVASNSTSEMPLMECGHPGTSC